MRILAYFAAIAGVFVLTLNSSLRFLIGWQLIVTAVYWYLEEVI